jgi:hypothetical protein
MWRKSDREKVVPPALVEELSKVEQATIGGLWTG